MAVYSPERMLQDFAERTLKNLNYIENSVISYGRDVYEVTQVMNSLLGIVVFPHEVARGSIPDLIIAELDPAKWTRSILSMSVHFDTLPQFLRCWRHAIAHGHIRFLPIADNVIGSVKFEATCEFNHNDIDWEITLDVDEIFLLVRTLCGLWTSGDAGINFPAPPRTHRNRNQNG